MINAFNRGVEADGKFRAEADEQGPVAFDDAPIGLGILVVVAVEDRHAVELDAVDVGGNRVYEPVPSAPRLEQFGGLAIQRRAGGSVDPCVEAINGLVEFPLPGLIH